MATNTLNPVIGQLRRAVLLPDGAGLTDGQLLEAFVGQRDEAAFGVLVRRHGPMVLGVCRRVLRNHHDAEDAFQATFLVLVRKADSILPREMVANWLYGVAYRTALKARGLIAKQRVRERQVTGMPEPEAAEPDDRWRELQPLLDQELSGLPDKYRVPVVLCDLEGKTGKETARQLGWPEGTVSSRLARGRTLLAKRLTRHGLALSGGSLAAVLSENAASASVPPAVVSSTIKAASLLAAGKAVATGAISAKVTALTEGVLRAMLLTKLRIATAVLLAVGVLGAGLGVALTYRTAAAGPAEAMSEAAPKDDQDRLQGTWQQVSCEGKDEVPDDLVKKTTLVVKDDTITVQTDGVFSYQLTFKLDESKTPKAIDEALVKPEKGNKPYLGIYSLEGDTLKFCFSDPGNKRPTEFTGKAGSGWTLTIFKRKQPSPAQPAQAKDEQPTKARREQATAIVRVPDVYTTAVGLTPNGTVLATGGSDHTVQLWDVVSGKPLHTLKGHTVAINCLMFSPDGKTLASATGDWVREAAPGEVKLWDVATGKERAPVKGHAGLVMALAFSPDGNTLASASETVKVWDVATGKEKVEIPGSGNSVSFSKNGTTLAIGRGVWEDNTPGWVELWDTTTWKQRAKLPGHVGMVPWVVFSPDNKTLASTDSKGTLKLWDAATGKERVTIGNPGWSFVLQPLAFTADGKTLVSTLRSTTVEGEGALAARAWEVASGKERATYSLPPEKADYLTPFLALSADGKTLAIGGFERLDKGKRPQSEWKINGVTAVWEVKSLPPKKPADQDQAKQVFDMILKGFQAYQDAKGGQKQPEDLAKQEMEKLQGTWRVVSSQVGDEKAAEDEVARRKVTVKGDLLIYDYGNERKEKQEGTIKLDPKTKAFDWTWTLPQAGATMLGIYDLKGDDLRIGFGNDGLVRPRRFVIGKEDVAWLLVLKRDTPNKDVPKKEADSSAKQDRIIAAVKELGLKQARFPPRGGQEF